MTVLRDTYGHPVESEGDGFTCPVPEHDPSEVVDLETATTVWVRDRDE
ncbi:hypothetical protein ACKVMT_13940 [Halobacteriales archaeon Cl-PHB]